MKTTINERLMVNLENLKFLKGESPPNQKDIDKTNERINKLFVPST